MLLNLLLLTHFWDFVKRFTKEEDVESVKRFTSSDIIRLSGGILGGGGAKQQQRQAPPPISDSARSISIGSVLEVICSGGKYGIKGVVDTSHVLNNLYLDETRARTPDGTFNFKVQTFTFANGYPFQSNQIGMTKSTNETTVGAEVSHGSPITRTFFNTEATDVEIRFSLILQKQIKDKDGYVVQVGGNSLVIRMELNKSITGGASTGFVHFHDFNLGGKFSEPYELEINIPLRHPDYVTPWDTFSVRISRLTAPDGIDDTRSFKWETFSQVIYEVMPLKRVAVSYIQFDTEQFGTNFPDRKYHIQGMFLDKPSNASIDIYGGSNYSGVWNGVIVGASGLEAASGDLFCIIWYLLTDKIDGLGEFIDINTIDRWSLYNASVYNNKILYYKKGKPERRVLYNLYINSAGDAWEKIDQILATSYTRKYWDGGILRFTQDRPTDVLFLVTNSDIEGDFIYSSTDIYERTNTIIVTWIDNDNFGKTRSTYVSIPEYVNKFGIVTKQLEAVGCTSQDQAYRFARHIIYSENLETKIVTFKARQYLKWVGIGDVIMIADAKSENKRLGGIVQSRIDASNIQIDYPVTFESFTGFDEKFYLYLYGDIRAAVRDGAFPSGLKHYQQYGYTEGRIPAGYLLFVQTTVGVEIRRIINPVNSAPTTTIQLHAPLTGTVKYGHSWIIYAPETSHETYRVLSKEFDEENLDLVSITATQYVEAKFNIIERRAEIVTDTVKLNPAQKATPPTNFRVFRDSNAIGLNINLTWTSPPGRGYKYKVGYRQSAGWIDAFCFTNTFTLENLTPGLYTFRVQSINYADLASDWVYSAEYTIGYTSSADYTGGKVFSMQKLVSSSTNNCVQVRRTSDGATTFIGYKYDWIDEDAIKAFMIGADTIEVYAWLEQNGSDNVFLTSATSPPTLVKSGVFSRSPNGKPCIQFNSPTAFLQGSVDIPFTQVISLSGETTIFLVNSAPSSDLAITMGITNTTTGERCFMHNTYGGTLFFDPGNPTTRRVSQTYDLTSMKLTATKATVNRSLARSNKQQLWDVPIPTISMTPSGTGRLKIGETFSGTIAEVIIFPFAHNNFITLESDRYNAYFG
jgi:predicted phage tail protein